MVLEEEHMTLVSQLAKVTAKVNASEVSSVCLGR